ncbi:Uncharacterised protein [Yersinia intermedia]|nr:Uncharacterised protein [Yersinia intermedia]CNG59373.1 Uncharacterised protein [Yersinia intermedia]
MKKIIATGMVMGLMSWQVAAQSFVLTDAEAGMDKGDWQTSSKKLKLAGADFSIEQKVLHGGK